MTPTHPDAGQRPIREKHVGCGWNYCCNPPCQNDAVWDIWYGDVPVVDQGTSSCNDCLGVLVMPGKRNSIVPCGWEA